MESQNSISPDALAEATQQENLLRNIQQAIHEVLKEKQGVNYQQVGETIKELRDDAITASESDLSTIFDQLNTQRALFERNHIEKIPDARAPYFAYLCLQEQEKVKHILLGYYTFLKLKQYPVIDWRHAPAARIFFNYREGDEYEEELPGRFAVGKVLKRVILTMDSGELVGIVSGSHRLKKIDQSWQPAQQAFTARFQGGEQSADRAIGTGQGGQASAQISALLDKTQYDLLNAPKETPLLVLGGAGCGKTTVALHRLALLKYQNKDWDSKNMMVIVPEEGLVRLTKRLLSSLGLYQIPVKTFDHWAKDQAYTVCKRLPKKVYADTPGNVIKFKRHPALLSGIAKLIEIQQNDVLEEIASIAPGFQRSRFSTAIEKSESLNQWFKKLEKFLKTSGLLSKKIQDAFHRHRKIAMDPLSDRSELYTNPKILDHIREKSGGKLSKSLCDEVLNYSREQLSKTARDRYKGVNLDNLKTIDGKSLADQESESELAGTVDAVDFIVMLCSHWEKTKGKTPSWQHFSSFQHLVIDEAQDLSAMELQVLGHSIEPDAAVTVAGDAAQQINETTDFSSWQEVLTTLGLPTVGANHLTTSYRCTKQITRFARRVLGTLDHEEGLVALRDGAEVTHSLMASDAHVSIFLADCLNDLLEAEPKASLAIICKRISTAQSIYNAIKELPKVRLILDGTFDFTPGIDVTLASQVKGLEFDYVVIPDASAHIYSDRPEDRRLLHVAATRAIHQLWAISVVKKSPILEFLDEN